MAILIDELRGTGEPGSSVGRGTDSPTVPPAGPAGGVVGGLFDGLPASVWAALQMVLTDVTDPTGATGVPHVGRSALLGPVAAAPFDTGAAGAADPGGSPATNTAAAAATTSTGQAVAERLVCRVESLETLRNWVDSLTLTTDAALMDALAPLYADAVESRFGDDRTCVHEHPVDTCPVKGCTGRPCPGTWGEDAVLVTTDEIALATGESVYRIRARVTFATDPAPAAHRLRTLVHAGELPYRWATHLHHAVDGLTDEQAETILDRVLAPVRGDRTLRWPLLTARLSKAKTRVLAAELDKEREQDVVTTAWTDLHGPQAHLHLLLGCDHGIAIMERLTTLARTHRATNDDGTRETLDHARARIAADLLLYGGLPGWHVPNLPVAAKVTVTVSADTLLGLSEEPGVLHGYGPITPNHARQLAFAPGSIWRRLLTDPTTGFATDLGRYQYRPSPRLADFIRHRDGTTRNPAKGHNAHAAGVDIDHITEYPAGRTEPINLAGSDRSTHRLKTLGVYSTSLSPDGTHHLTTLTGRTYTAAPVDHRDPNIPHEYQDGRWPQVADPPY